MTHGRPVPRWDLDTLPAMEPKRPSDSRAWICRFNSCSPIRRRRMGLSIMTSWHFLDSTCQIHRVLDATKSINPKRPGCRRVKVNTRAVTFAVPLETAEDDLAACLRAAIVFYAACGLPMQEDVEEGAMDVQAAVVF